MDKLKQATEYAKSGNKIKARQLLAELLQSEPNNELAWLWMSGVVDNTSQQRYCLEQVLCARRKTFDFRSLSTCFQYSRQRPSYW
jgi:hypothetical protein